ncbi:MAG: ComF family protein [Vulcanimicrobiaceae bacterium]
MWNAVLALLFPRACIGCERDGVLLCERCARAGGEAQRIVLGGISMRAALPYDGALRTAIVEFKRGRRSFAPDLAALLEPLVERSMTLVPIPTTPRRIAERGYDQTVLLSRLLQVQCGVDVAEMLRRPSNAAQQGRSRSERIATTGRFAVNTKLVEPRGNLVLFDDVRTTGATLLDAAGALRESKYDVCDAVTLAWTPLVNT